MPKPGEKKAKPRLNAGSPSPVPADLEKTTSSAVPRSKKVVSQGVSPAPAAAKTRKSRSKPKWINSLPSAPYADAPRRGGKSVKSDALDSWVNAPPPNDLARAQENQTVRSIGLEPVSETAPNPGKAPHPAKRKSSSAPISARSAAKANRREDPPASAESVSAIAPSPAALPSRSTSAEPAPLPKATPAVSASPSSSDGDAFGGYYPIPNVEALANNIANAIEQAGKAMAAYLRPRASGEIKSTIADDVGEMIRSLGHVTEYYMSDPKRAIEAQTALTTQFVNLWAATLQRFQGLPAEPVAEPDRTDKRFSDAQWRDNPFFDFLKQAYVLTTRWADDLIRRADELEPHKRLKAQFYLRQVSAALAPSNFIGTNPELIRATLQESGENLVRGLRMLAEDIEAGKGNLRIRQSDARSFKLGVNLATTPGKVIFRNDLIELIQYEPATPEVYKRPLLIVPPWINKFYILDLNPEKSFIRWAVSQGLTVFVISWVNPDGRHADKDFDAYMHEGILTALDCLEQATGERDVTTIGYCVGGTLLASTLGYMAAVGDKRINSVTFFTALVDFTDCGDLQVFVDAEQLKAVEERMAEQGYLEGAAMAQAFNMLRPNDLIWAYYINNYLRGKEPIPFDLLVWNSDSTRMPAANHKFYLRHCYFQNDLSNGRMELSGKTVDLKKVTIPIYQLATKEDHIAPARGVFKGAKVFGGPVKFVLAGSGHIAGVVNPAGKPKYQYWTNGPVTGDFDAWVAAANETPGSWWLDWIQWIAAQAPEKVPARQPGEGKLKAIGDAPGEYVRVKA